MSASKTNKNRPLSPHLMNWRWGPAMAVSILHRIAGNGMAVVGGVIIIWWLVALAGGPDSYASFIAIATHPLGYLVLIGLTWAFFQHLLSGLRHFVLDAGAGYEVDTNNRWSMVLPILAVLLTGAFWLVVFFV